MPRGARAAAAGRSQGLAARVAYFALLAVPALVPIVVFKVPFVAGPALTLNPAVIPKLFVFSLLMCVALAAWAIGAVWEGTLTRSVPLKWWLLALLAISAVSTVFGIHPATSFFGNGYYATGLLTLLLGGALYFLVVQLVDSPARIRAMSWSVAAGGTIVGVVGLLQAIGADPMRLGLEYHYMWLRVGSLLGNSDFLGAYLVVPLVVSAALVIAARTTVERSLAAGSLAIVFLCLLSSGTRGAWLGAAAGLAALGIAAWRGELKLSKAALAAAGAALAVPLAWALLNVKSILVRFADLTQGSAAGGGRIPIWADALRVIAKHPLLGTGPDGYLLGWYGARTPAWVGMSGSKALVDDPHNMFLLYAATLGIPATIAVVGLIVRAIAASSEPALRRDSSAGRRLFSGWWAALMAVTVTLVTTVSTVPMVITVFLCLGMAVTVRAEAVDFPRPLRNGLAGVAVVLGLASAVAGTLYVVSDGLLARAQQSPSEIAIFDQAATLAPWYGEARSAAAGARGSVALGELRAGSPAAHDEALRAEAGFERLVAFDPHELQFRVAQATFLVNAGQYLGPDTLRAGVAAGQAAMAINPGNPRAAYVAAMGQYLMGDYAAAVGTLEPLWNSDPSYADPGVLYARSLAAAGRRATAETVLANLKQRFPNSDQVLRLESELGTPTPAP